MYPTRTSTSTVAAGIIAILTMANCVFAQPCKNAIVVPGETLDEVSAECGAPAVKDHREVSEEESDGNGTARHITVIDEWTFDSGPEQMMETYFFENGKLTEIRSAGYGRLRDPLADPCHNGESLAVGDTPVDAYLKCGEPLARERRENKVVETVEEGKKRRISQSVVEWTYRFGPNAPGYTLRFENGVVVEVRAREFGK